MCKRISLDAPDIGELEKRYLSQAVEGGFVSTIGPYIPEFEEKIAKYLGVEKAIATQSGTAALHIALYELGIGEGDEVIIPSLTFVATVNPVMHLKAKPVFVDVEEATWNIDPKEIEKNITKDTKAIIPVHLYGNPCNMDAIINIAKKHNLAVIEDAAEGLGARYKGKYLGTFGDMGCFSFNGNKLITTGGGGLVISGDKDKLEHIKFLINQARDNQNDYYHSEVGFNYRMTNIEAALGLAQMERLGEFLNKNREFNSVYRKELKDIEFIRFQEEYKEAESSWWFTSLVFEKEINLNVLQEQLREKGIPTRKTFMPIVEFPPYKKYKNSGHSNSYNIFNRGLCLPSSVLNSRDDIYYVCKVFKSIVSSGESEL